MPFSVAKQLTRYRTLLIALANAGITWIILIIAPLGLFAVITCTALVFASSFIFGTVGDFALFALLKPSGWQTMRSPSASQPFEDVPYSSNYTPVSERQNRRNLPE